MTHTACLHTWESTVYKIIHMSEEEEGLKARPGCLTADVKFGKI